MSFPTPITTRFALRSDEMYLRQDIQYNRREMSETAINSKHSDL